MSPEHSTLLASLRQASLLPSKLIPEDFTPSTTVSITYPNKSINPGDLARVSEVAIAPNVAFSGDASAGYTFMMLDPDAPTPEDPKFAFWRHWVVARVKPSASEGQGTLDSGVTLTRYLAPGPKDESGPHRYLFLVFREPEGVAIRREDVGGEEFVERRGFGAEEFVEGRGLQLVGVNWMRGVGDGWMEE
ncbi:PEBP-like protein [Lojkania enalia]|uniref:PEBP-like protein n=1 Tax=Lojkania enalia TaxID=147567 RepID=A0A9P4MVY1_9PLEO|nr:PEBP-like protein [Didymosphaeria enalia]